MPNYWNFLINASNARCALAKLSSTMVKLCISIISLGYENGQIYGKETALKRIISSLLCCFFLERLCVNHRIGPSKDWRKDWKKWLVLAAFCPPSTISHPFII
jgi:hypothetical protein